MTVILYGDPSRDLPINRPEREIERALYLDEYHLELNGRRFDSDANLL